MNEITALQLRDSAQQAIANIKTIESGVEYLNKVKAIEIWAKAERKDAELQNMIAEQKIRTQRVLGRLIREGQEKGEIARQDTGGTGSNQYASVPGGNTCKNLSDVGVTRKQSFTFKAIEAVPEEEFENIIAKGKDEKTELTKIIEGWGDYFFYGFSDNNEHELIAWKLCNLGAFRLFFNRYIVLNNGKVPGTGKTNNDGSSDFLVFNAEEIPGFVIASKN